MTLQTTDAELVQIFQETKTIALIGASLKPQRASHYVGQFLADLGYRVIPINPGHAGEALFGETIAASLKDIDDPSSVDMIDIFRRSDLIPEIVDEAMDVLPNLKTVWMQLGLESASAAQKASGAGIMVVQDKCPKIEYPRLDSAGLIKDLAS